MRRIKTVRIETDNEQGFYLLNESDFNPKIHKLFGVKVDPVEPVDPVLTVQQAKEDIVVEDEAKENKKAKSKHK
jgi:hypothetical protein